MSESDANRDLVDTTRLRALDWARTLRADDPFEDTQRMEVCQRRDRQREATLQSMAHGWVLDEGHKLLAKLRERRRPRTVGQRQPGTPQSDTRQAVVDFLNQQQGDL